MFTLTSEALLFFLAIGLNTPTIEKNHKTSILLTDFVNNLSNP